MFGKPQWFRPKSIGVGIVPVSWQGWLYTAGWTSAVTIPFLLLIGRHQPFEATIWMVVSLGALFFDVRQIRRSITHPSGPVLATSPRRNPTEDNVLYILDSQPEQELATRNFNLRVQR